VPGCSHGWIFSNDCQERETANTMRCLIYRMVAALVLAYWKLATERYGARLPRCHTRGCSLGPDWPSTAPQLYDGFYGTIYADILL
jgi:hypothetical protein